MDNPIPRRVSSEKHLKKKLSFAKFGRITKMKPFTKRRNKRGNTDSDIPLQNAETPMADVPSGDLIGSHQSTVEETKLPSNHVVLDLGLGNVSQTKKLKADEIVSKDEIRIDIIPNHTDSQIKNGNSGHVSSVN